MARTVIVGHGGFDIQSEYVLVPPGTSITFLADAGSPLSLPAVEEADGHLRFEYEKIAPLLDRFLEAEKPRKEYEPTFNMSITTLDDDEIKLAKDLEAQGKWGGELITQVGSGSMFLCTGDERSCPTLWHVKADEYHTKLLGMDAEQQKTFTDWVAAGAAGTVPEGFSEFVKPDLCGAPDLFWKYLAEGVPDDAWHHKCQGILSPAVAEGKEIVWLSCSGFVYDEADLEAIGLSEGLPSEMEESTGMATTWAPDDAVLDAVKELNSQKVKDTPDGGSVRIRAGGFLVLVGSDHEGNVENYVKRQADFSEGTLAVKKGGAFTKGTLTVSGISSTKQQIVKDSLELFSDKKVVFA